MIVHKLIFWSILYPIAFIGFFSYILVQCLMFLFHSPVDVWCMIGEEVKKQRAEDR